MKRQQKPVRFLKIWAGMRTHARAENSLRGLNRCGIVIEYFQKIKKNMGRSLRRLKRIDREFWTITGLTITRTLPIIRRVVGGQRCQAPYCPGETVKNFNHRQTHTLTRRTWLRLIRMLGCPAERRGHGIHHPARIGSREGLRGSAVHQLKKEE